MERGNSMSNPNSGNQTIRQFCRCWFELRDAGLAEEFLADDIHFVGTGEQEYADGREDMARYLREDIREIPEPFQVDFSVLNEQQLGENVYVMSAAFSLKNSVYAWHLRCFFVLKQQKGRWLVCDLNFSEPSSSQGKGGTLSPDPGDGKYCQTAAGTS